MSVLPGSLDYLYYNGVLNSIPYEAYEGHPMMGSYSQAPMNTAIPGMNATQYLNNARCGDMYNTYTSPDTFVKANPYCGEQDNFRESILNAANDMKTSTDKKVDKKTLVKGMLGLGTILATILLLCRGKKK